LTQKWYFEKWHEYQKKKGAIENLYLDVLIWGTNRSKSNLLSGKNRLALDIGSAHGYVVSLLTRIGYITYGCELSKYYIKSYAKKTDNDFVICDAQDFPFAEKKVNLITAFEVIEHMPKYQKFIDQCYNALKVGGALLITTPQANLKPLNLKFWRDLILGSFIFHNNNLDEHFHEFFSSKELKMKLGLERFRYVIAETWWFAPIPPTLFNRYFVGHLPLFMIPHFRCVAIK
jgi:2-polyprenyl-3-methyl-5-hydroxy-6-metoxy-1,4-benzoquinol methylase